MVIDEANGQRRPRYLAYDVVRFEDEKVGKGKFSLRLYCIQKEIVETREKYQAEVSGASFQQPRLAFTIISPSFRARSTNPASLFPSA